MKRGPIWGPSSLVIEGEIVDKSDKRPTEKEMTPEEIRRRIGGEAPKEPRYIKGTAEPNVKK